MAHRANDGGGSGGGRRAAWVVGVAIAVVAAFGIGFAMARGGDDGATPTPSPSMTPTADATRTQTPEPTQTQTPDTSATPTDGSGTDLEDGRNYGYPTKATDDSVTVDIALFLTGQEAAEAAADHGDESPPPNDYYVVNDNPRLRTLPVASDVRVRYVPVGQDPSVTVNGNWDAFAAAVNGAQQTDYPEGGWWFTLRDGVVVKVEFQWVP